MKYRRLDKCCKERPLPAHPTIQGESTRRRGGFSAWHCNVSLDTHPVLFTMLLEIRGQRRTGKKHVRVDPYSWCAVTKPKLLQLGRFQS